MAKASSVVILKAQSSKQDYMLQKKWGDVKWNFCSKVQARINALIHEKIQKVLERINVSQS